MGKVIKLEVLEFEEDGQILAFGTEHFIPVWANDREELMKRFQDQLAIQTHVDIALHDQEPFADKYLDEEIMERFKVAKHREVKKFPIKLRDPVESERYEFEVDWRRE
jgi:hypothetical protein